MAEVMRLPDAGAMSAARPCLVEGRSVVRIFRRHGSALTALTAASFVVHQADHIALVGPSGSGKSTLLHLMGALDTPTYGTITWPALGAPETLRPAKVAFVFQAPSLLPPLTVVENVELPLLLGRLAAAEARTAAEAALARLELSGLAEKLPEELSGGQKQRVAMARALAYRPQLILADEPTGQLDRATGQREFDVLLDAVAGTQTALAVATHDLAIADRMQSIWRLRHGVLEVHD